MVSFRREDRERVASGEITVSFRLWTSARVRAGKTYETGFGTVEVEDVRVVPAALVSDEDVRLAGLPDREAVWQLAGEHKGEAVGPDTLLYRVQFRFVPGGRPSSRREPESDLVSLRERLAKMDRLSRSGPWTMAALRLIEAAPGVPARVLAAEIGMETQDFKERVRRLKALGLTTSLEVGYELSDLGREYLTLAAVESLSKDTHSTGPR